MRETKDTKLTCLDIRLLLDQLFTGTLVSSEIFMSTLTLLDHFRKQYDNIRSCLSDCDLRFPLHTYGAAGAKK